MKHDTRKLRESISRYKQRLDTLGEPTDARERLKLVIYRLLLDKNLQRLEK